jgi:O-antigen/teichoic acid export membrane protein
MIPPERFAFLKGFGGAVTAVTGIFGRAANQIIALIVTLLAARFLTPVSFGEYSIAAALVTFSRAMLYAGAYEYLLKAPRGEESPTECLAINLGLAAAMGALLALLSLFTTPLFHSAEVGFLLLALAPSSLLSAAANWQESQLLRSGRLKTYYGVTTFAEVIAAIVTVSMILLGFALGALIAQIYARLFLLMATYRALQKPMWSRAFSLERAWRVARWSTHRYGATIVAFLSNYSADLLLGAFLSPAATGLYRASHRMVTGVSDLVSNPTRLTAVTIFSSRSAAGLESGPLWPRIAAASAFIGWTALAGLAAISEQVVPLVLGPRWAAAGPIVAILCLQRAFSLIDGVTGPMLVAYSHVRALFGVQLAMAIASVALLAVMAHYGVAAAAFSSVLTAAASMVILIAMASRNFAGLIGGLPRVLPVAVVPALATSMAAFVASRYLAAPAPDVLTTVVREVVAGAAGFAAAVVLQRRSVVEMLQALNPPSHRPSVPEEAQEVRAVAAAR